MTDFITHFDGWWWGTESMLVSVGNGVATNGLLWGVERQLMTGVANKIHRTETSQVENRYKGVRC